MEPIRKLYIQVLTGEDRTEKSILKCTFAARLAKFPALWHILGDRGFARNAILYPNLNYHYSPQFIEGREQFSKNELMNDQVTCRLRYIAEVIFSRCTDENMLLDVIPRNNFNQLSHAIHWAHASANLGKAFHKDV